MEMHYDLNTRRSLLSQENTENILNGTEKERISLLSRRNCTSFSLILSLSIGLFVNMPKSVIWH